jgi:hypothetical protein
MTIRYPPTRPIILEWLVGSTGWFQRFFTSFRMTNEVAGHLTFIRWECVWNGCYKVSYKVVGVVRRVVPITERGMRVEEERLPRTTTPFVLSLVKPI